MTNEIAAQAATDTRAPATIFLGHKEIQEHKLLRKKTFYEPVSVVPGGHVFTAAGSGAGRFISTVIPNVERWDGPVAMPFDFKGQAWNTVGCRHDKAVRVARSGKRVNLLGDLKLDDPMLLLHLEAMAKALIPAYRDYSGDGGAVSASYARASLVVAALTVLERSGSLTLSSLFDWVVQRPDPSPTASAARYAAAHVGAELDDMTDMAVQAILTRELCWTGMSEFEHLTGDGPAPSELLDQSVFLPLQPEQIQAAPGIYRMAAQAFVSAAFARSPDAPLPLIFLPELLFLRGVEAVEAMLAAKELRAILWGSGKLSRDMWFHKSASVVQMFAWGNPYEAPFAVEIAAQAGMDMHPADFLTLSSKRQVAVVRGASDAGHMLLISPFALAPDADPALADRYRGDEWG